MVTQLFKKFPISMECEGSVLWSQKPDSELYLSKLNSYSYIVIILGKQWPQWLSTMPGGHVGGMDVKFHAV
jgi:hypothetical protein